MVCQAEEILVFLRNLSQIYASTDTVDIIGEF